VKRLLQTASVKVLVRGGGDLASGVAWRLHQSGFRVVITEIREPLAVRRKVAFCEAVYDGQCAVEGVRAVLVTGPEQVDTVWDQGFIPVLVDPEATSRNFVKPEVIVDAILAKKNLGTSAKDAPLVMALGPGFEVGKDAHFVVETSRGHTLGRLLASGSAAPNTGIPGPVQGITADRVLRAPASGLWRNVLDIGDMVRTGDVIGTVQGEALCATIGGALRGLIHPGITVSRGLKIGDIDPRGKKEFCFTISEKALAIAGGVLEGILRTYGRKQASEKRNQPVASGSGQPDGR
jgi:xanthine dehydrogenase accessory factor